jgi:hypothetical protein
MGTAANPAVTRRQRRRSSTLTKGSPVTAPAHPAARDHCLAPSRTSTVSVGARYGRLFPELPPLRLDPTTLSGAGGPGGPCDAGADEPEEPDDGRESAGWPFFGQLVAHDVTADRSPPSPTEQVDALRNARRPRLDLEMLYADGPVGMPYLFDTRDPVKLLTGDHGHDLPRNSQGVALIGDPRNDVHLFVASLHLALLHAHNGLVDRLRADGVTEDDLVVEARRSLTWHYQWIVVHDFLPRVVGSALTAQVLTEGGRYFAPGQDEAYIPLEFADAAYRYGHSQIRRGYQLRAGGPTLPLFPDCVGFGPIPAEHRLSWERLFAMPGSPPPQRAKRLDGRLPESLIALPHQITGELTDSTYESLAVRDLMRGEGTGLPSGEAVAEVLGAPPVSSPGWPDGTPLWLYVLREADLVADGAQLGPVGGRIVAEVLIGLLRADPASYLCTDPGWRPSLPAAGDTFGLADLLAFAEAVREDAG